MRSALIFCLLLTACASRQPQPMIDASLFHPLNPPDVVIETWRCQLKFDQMLETEKLNCGLLGVRAALPVKDQAALRGFMQRVTAHDTALPGIFPDDFEFNND